MQITNSYLVKVVHVLQKEKYSFCLLKKINFSKNNALNWVYKLL